MKVFLAGGSGAIGKRLIPLRVSYGHDDPDSGSSNAKAKRLLDWKPTHTSWRDGFRRMLLEGGREAA